METRFFRMGDHGSTNSPSLHGMFIAGCLWIITLIIFIDHAIICTILWILEWVICVNVFRTPLRIILAKNMHKGRKSTIVAVPIKIDTEWDKVFESTLKNSGVEIYQGETADKVEKRRKAKKAGRPESVSATVTRTRPLKGGSRTTAAAPVKDVDSVLVRSGTQLSMSSEPSIV